MRTIVPKRHPVDEPRHRATSWHRGPDPDAEISFADIAAMPDPDWIGRNPQAGFVFDAELLEPLELTDWSAQLADAFELADASLTFKAQAFKEHLKRVGADYVMAVRVVTGAHIADAKILADEAKAFAAELKAQVA